MFFSFYLSGGKMRRISNITIFLAKYFDIDNATILLGWLLINITLRQCNLLKTTRMISLYLKSKTIYSLMSWYGCNINILLSFLYNVYLASSSYTFKKHFIWNYRFNISVFYSYQLSECRKLKAQCGFSQFAAGVKSDLDKNETG